jgi:hypothetical protein
MEQKHNVNTLRGGKDPATGRHDATASYHVEKCRRIAAALARLGNANEVEFALALGISIPTFHLWKREHPEFTEALETPPEASTVGFERSLLRCALG